MIQAARNVRADLTDRQADILGFIVSYIEQNGFSPTIRDIGRHFGISSPNGVMCHIRALRTKGYLNAEPRLARAFRPSVIARLGLRSQSDRPAAADRYCLVFAVPQPHANGGRLGGRERNRPPNRLGLPGASRGVRMRLLGYGYGHHLSP